MDLQRIGLVLRSKTRLRLIQVLADDRLSAQEIHSRVSERGGGHRHRESTYRDLEIMVDAEIMEKTYDKKEKAIVYRLVTRYLRLDLLDQRGV